MNTMHRVSKLNLSVMDENDDAKICALGRALSSRDRMRILRLLSEKPMNVLEIAEALGLAIEDEYDRRVTAFLRYTHDLPRDAETLDFTAD